ncbi:hypothetical protein OZX57_04865 [Bifidobacterium sp. ESL0682]|nr:hypothetical protein [Bifidobacterium sp. ESL0682]WEV41391.1 hypothetical protein OZX57_04865 [Bifidobacterium sp. ESL0682]
MKKKLTGQVRNALRQVGVAAKAADIPLIDLMDMLENEYKKA